MERKKRIVIAEDHAILRQGLQSMLNIEEAFEVVGEAEDGLGAIRIVNKTEPDLAIIDLSMPKMSGISVILEIRKSCPQTRIIVLTMHKEEDYILQAFRSGADGYCLKSSDLDELIIAIKAVLSGKQYVSPEISGKILEGYLESQKTIREKSSWDTLTMREKEVLKLVGEGYQNKKIADYLCISIKTVETHRANIMQKLDIHTASGLTAYAIENGLVTK